MMDKCNIKQQRFIEFYLQSGNATKAAIEAGYKGKYPDRYAHELLNKPYIKAELDKTREKMNSTAKLTYEYKLDVLYQGIKHYVQSGDYDKIAKLIEVSNKMQGHNAPDKSLNTITFNNELTVLKELTEEYLNEHHRKHANH